MTDPGIYATRADFETYGIRRDVLASRARTISAVDPVSNRLAVNAHGWSGTEPLQFSVASAVPGTTPAPALPSGLSATQVYYPLPVPGSDTLFQAAATIGGAPVALVDAGAGTLLVTEQIGPMIDRVLRAASSRVDRALVNYDTPLTAWPEIVTWAVCKLAAWDLMQVRGLVDPSYAKDALEGLGRTVDEAKSYMAEWLDGAPIQGMPKALDDTDELENGTATLDGGGTPCWLPPCGGI